MSGLINKRQFLLTKGTINVEHDWLTIDVNGDYTLYYDRTLDVEITNDNNVTLVMVGIALDPYNPNYTNKDIIEGLRPNSGDLQGLFNSTYHLGGRWALFYIKDGEVKVFHDACGMRRVFYSNSDQKVIASSANLIAKHLNIDVQMSEEMENFVYSSTFERTERAWIGDKTIYPYIYRLLPNHYLDFHSSYVYRLPINLKNDSTYEFDTILDKINDLIKGSLSSLSQRYSLLQGVTAGWDSRLLLANSLDINNNINFFVSSKNTMSEREPDIKIPKKLSNQFDFSLNHIKELPSLSKESEVAIKENVMLGRNLPKHKTVQYHLENSDKKLIVNGNVGEITRDDFMNLDKNDISLKSLRFKFPEVNFTKNEFAEWHGNASDFSITNSLPLADLFFIEQWIANWGAMYPAEQDIAVEEITPYNNRELLLAVMKYKKLNGFTNFQREILQKYYSEMLEVPVNPKTIKIRVKNLIKKLIRY